MGIVIFKVYSFLIFDIWTFNTQIFAKFLFCVKLSCTFNLPLIRSHFRRVLKKKGLTEIFMYFLKQFPNRLMLTRFGSHSVAYAFFSPQIVLRKAE